MPVIPVLHRKAEVRSLVRRGTRGTGVKVVACRDWDRLEALASQSVIDAVVIDVHRNHRRALARWVASYPSIPVFGFGGLRPDDAPMIQEYWDVGVADVLVGKAEDPVVGEMVAARTTVNSLVQELHDAPRLFRLTEPIQLRVWREIMGHVDEEIRTVTIAEAVRMSREHLSREFAAGGAPNLKRVIDFAKIVMAARLLENPGYNVSIVTRVLRFATPSHLATCADRVAGVKPSTLADLGPRGIMNRFRRGRMRSRL